MNGLRSPRALALQSAYVRILADGRKSAARP